MGNVSFARAPRGFDGLRRVKQGTSQGLLGHFSGEKPPFAGAEQRKMNCLGVVMAA